MKRTCLFCRRPLSDEPGESNVEHVMPVSLGGSGWLTTRLVCRDCNSWLGREVDKVADIPLLVALRAEAGLSPHYDLRGHYVDPESGEVVEGRMGFGRPFEETERYYERGDRIMISARTTERAQAIADKIAERRRQEGRPVTFRTPHMREGRAELISLDQRSTRVSELNELLVREAAKMAVEYVALLVGLEVALMSELDPLRAAALYGSPTESVLVNYFASDAV